MMNNTRDLSQFGNRERSMAGRLLTAMHSPKDKTEYLGDGVVVEFNPNSANVFLVDDDCNVAMMNGDHLEDFLNCPECGNEGFKSDLNKNIGNYNKPCCKDWLKEMET